MLTVGDILRSEALGLHGIHVPRPDADVRWVATSELPDPAAWTLERLCQPGPDGRYGALMEVLEACESAAYHVSDAIGVRYFTLTSDTVRSVGV